MTAHTRRRTAPSRLAHLLRRVASAWIGGLLLGLSAAAPAATLLTEYRFEEALWNGSTGELRDTAGYAGGPFSGKASSATAPTGSSASPARGGDPGTCRYATMNGPANGGSVFTATTVPVSGGNGAQTSVSFWMYWDGTGTPIPVGFTDYVLWITSGYIGFNSNSSDIYGTSSSGLANGWHHVVAVFTNGGVSSNSLYIDGVSKVLSQVIGSPNAGRAKVNASMTIGGDGLGTDFRLMGRLDEMRIYNGALSAAEVASDYARTQPCNTLIAQYRFEEASWSGSAGELKDTAGYATGPFNGAAQGSPLPSAATASPARTSSSGTCGYATLPGPANNGGNFLVNSLPVSTTTGAQTTIAFWMYWSGPDNVIPISWNTYDLWLTSGTFGFNTTASDVYGISSAGLSGGWHHVVAVFTNGNVTNNKLYIDGVAQTLTQRAGTPSLSLAKASGTLQIGGYGNGNTAFRFSGSLDEVKVYNGAVSAAQVAALYAETHTCPVLLDHLEIQHGSGSGLTCTPSTLTVRACQNAACTTLYTGGVTGTLTASGTGMTVNWPTGAAFSIPSGSSSIAEDVQLTTVGSVVLGISSPAPAANSATTCNFGSPSCTFKAADSGLLFDVPNHRAEVSNTVTVTAVKKSDNSASCTPAFAGVSKPITFKCGYTNPGSGTLPVRVGGAALNSANNTAAACDATGRAVSLVFDATGKASTSVIYADVGQVSLTATYTGSGADAGLSMTGTDSFITAPTFLSVYGVTGGNIAAGNVFNASVAAKNYIGNLTPNFGREATAESVTMGFVRTQPQGTGAVNGSFSGSLGGFGSGAATATNLKWSEVGKGEVTALLASGNYLGSGMNVAGASNYMTSCAAEGGTCTLPAGVTAFVTYGANGWINTAAGVTGSIACNNGPFGDPLWGVTKACNYFVTSGSSAASSGTAGPFIPHHFDVTTAPACSSFSYAGQPFGTTVTARNASNGTTLNYDGTATTTPNFAKATTLSDAVVLGLGAWSGQNVALTAFAAGVATATPSYAFTTKTTAPQTLTVRAVDADAVSSSGYAEGSMLLRSGRLRLSNAFGSEKAALAMTVQAQYWGGNAWVPNGADSCTVLPVAAVVRSNYLDNRGAATAAWTTTASAVNIVSGSGTLSLSAPSPTATGSVDIALNLGAGAADQSCLATHPASTGAALPWLRSQQGSCAATWDRDPAARASFGIYVPETRKTLHVREIF